LNTERPAIGVGIANVRIELTARIGRWIERRRANAGKRTAARPAIPRGLAALTAATTGIFAGLFGFAAAMLDSRLLKKLS